MKLSGSWNSGWGYTAVSVYKETNIHQTSTPGANDFLKLVVYKGGNLSSESGY